MKIEQFYEMSERLRKQKSAFMQLMFALLISLLLLCGYLAKRPPLVVEVESNGCSNVVKPKNATSLTKSEIEAFLNLALSARFDSKPKNQERELLSILEQGHRAVEMAELERRRIGSRLLVDSFDIDGDDLKVDATRVFSVDTIRSSFPIKIDAKLRSVSRTTSNPFGLIIEESAIEENKTATSGENKK